ncbi:NAD(P)H-hydrate dehydratase [Nostoc sp. 3335mG]|nr:NAD(P)H-hydrate dehydratase [Nostoc sp. 3335mG]
MTAAAHLDEKWLSAHPLPDADEAADKDAKGRLLIVGGSLSVPGALLLSTEAAMRVGVGKVKVATIEQAAMPLGVAFPEAAVVGLASTREGEIASRAIGILSPSIKRSDAILIGPAMSGGAETRDLVQALLGTAGQETSVLLDAGAVSSAGPLCEGIANAGSSIVLTPHCGEMASLMDIDKADVEAAQPDVATQAARRFRATVVLKSSSTFVASPAGDLLRYDSDCPGLGTAGSGDVLAGVIAGLLARGVEPLVASAWGVWLHGACGREATRIVGPIGFMARDLPPFLPQVLRLGAV